MLAGLFIAAMPFVAFPKEGARLPAIDRVYLVGSVQKGETNVVVNGKDVAVYRTGAWATMVDVCEESNSVSVVSQSGEATNIWFRVAKKPASSGGWCATEKKEWKKLSYAKDEPKAPPRGKTRGEVLVVVDPGHGGSDTGAVSPHGFCEKEANLSVSLALRDALLARGYKVMLTRETDAALELYDRPKAAHENNADLFVSIHHNAPPFDKDPLELRYSAVYSWNSIGEELAKAISAKLGEAFADEYRSNGALHANFAVTRNPEIPSCLVEADFVTSPAGEEAIWDAGHRRRVAESIADGIDSWCAGAGVAFPDSNMEEEQQ